MRIWFKSVPFSKEDVTLALESGVDGLIVPAEQVEHVAGYARCQVRSVQDMPSLLLDSKDEEGRIVARLQGGESIVLAHGWEIIPVENLLAQSDNVALEVTTVNESRLAAGILERGVQHIVVLAQGVNALKDIVRECKIVQGNMNLGKAVVTKIQNVGLGHRVCVDTLSVLQKGQGMLVGNSSAFTFLVHAETEHNEYVAARPFRVNAGAVHAYAHMPEDTTRYLGELGTGHNVLIVDAKGNTSLACIGRVKTEVRPMLLVEACTETCTGNIFLQNAETICLTRPDGTPVSVVKLQEGDEVLCHLDSAGRHFGMRITEEIQEG